MESTGAGVGKVIYHIIVKTHIVLQTGLVTVESCDCISTCTYIKSGIGLIKYS